ncbi:MAG: hypothetical protein ABEJ69_03810 [Candidatus Nanohaloarchaea archaeon]
MALLATVFIFVNLAGIETPSISNGDGSGPANNTQNNKQPPEPNGLLKQSFSGLYSLYNASANGWQDIAKLAED